MSLEDRNSCKPALAFFWAYQQLAVHLQSSKALLINVPGEADGQGQWFPKDLPSPTVCFQEEHAESVPVKASSEIVNGLFFILLLVV